MKERYFIRIFQKPPEGLYPKAGYLRMFRPIEKGVFKGQYEVTSYRKKAKVFTTQKAALQFINTDLIHKPFMQGIQIVLSYTGGLVWEDVRIDRAKEFFKVFAENEDEV